MIYLTTVCEGYDEWTWYSGPVADSDAQYLRHAGEFVKPLTDEEYMTGPAVILHTLAKHSYVLDGTDLFWCIQWDPGLLILKMVPGESLSWIALRSPIPDVGGREPLPEDVDTADFDEDDNPQYNLIFTPWDASFDQQQREWDSFVPSSDQEIERLEASLSRVNALGPVMESRFSTDTDQWFQLCKKNINTWCGEGLRLKPSR